MQTDTARFEGLVERLVGLAFKEAAPEIKTLVGHRFPDDDAWLCLWMAKNFIAKTKKAQVVFVNAGEILPGTDSDPTVIHFDTGGREYDQHGKSLKNTSSSHLLAKGLGLDDPGLEPLLELAKAVDNIERLPATSVHFIIEGYPRRLEFQKSGGIIDWQKIQERVFELFDIIYGQETQRVQNRKALREHAEWTTLPNGIKIASLFWHPELREAAFEQGAAVVVWTQFRRKDRFYVGIQRHRDYPSLQLNKVAEMIRFREGKVRNIDVMGKNLQYIGRGEPVKNWFLHDSLGLILSGSRSWKLEPEEYTNLAPQDIAGIVHRALGNIPREVVSQWKKQ
ncbi:MAG: hypothetical protein HYT19_00420 [Candidatus Nealsonbacteria bacterium]|nr:hypothetical protein [Candidatus Nealsonbacteria bacterium]